MIKYKLTTPGMTTFNGFKWVVGKTYETSGEGELCGVGWLHFYDSPELAVLLNSIHATIFNPRLWKVKVKGKTLSDKGLKCGFTSAKIIKEIALPNFTDVQIIAFGIFCSLEVYK